MESLRKWFKKHQRELPWRETSDPYAVWVSEVMLQQTQVQVVIPYFLRWMELFPTVEKLAQAPIEHVIKAWEGLGYYSRARNLHAAANEIVRDWGGQLPSTVAELEKICGFGPYTSSAVAAFAFKQKAAAVDGNVLRVMARFLGYEGSISKGSARQEIAQQVFVRLPDERPWEVMEGLIELGALVCMRKPRCVQCPLIKECVAFRDGLQERLPIKDQRKKTITLHREVACIFSQGCVLLSKGREGQVMQDLWQFPFVEKGEPLPFTFKMKQVKELPRITHTFTQYRAYLYPVVWESDSRPKLPGFTWHNCDALKSLSFSSGHRQIIKEMGL